MKKKLWRGEYVFDIEYEIGHWFWKKTIQETGRWDATAIILAKDEIEAAGKFQEIHEFNEIVWWAFEHMPNNYRIIHKGVSVYQTIKSIDNLKSRMYADEFLAYCRQELIDPQEIVQ